LPGETVVTELKSTNKDTYVTTNPAYIYIKHSRIDLHTMQNLRVTFDGQDVTAFSTITERSTSYAPPKPLSIGRHRVELVGTNSIGQQFETRIFFKVEAAGPPVSSSSVPYAMVTTSNGTIIAGPVINPSSMSLKIFDNLTAPVNVGNKVTVTMLGLPGGVATFDVGSTTGIRMHEISAGNYIGTYRVQANDNFNNATLVGHLAIPTGEMFVASSPTINPTSYYAGLLNEQGLTQITILSPRSGDQLTPPFVISGTTLPNSDVILTTQAADGTRQRMTVASDSNGNFSATISSTQTSPGTQYLITAVSRDADGNLGSSSSITVVQR